MREILNIQAGQCGNQIGSRVSILKTAPIFLSTAGSVQNLK